MNNGSRPDGAGRMHGKTLESSIQAGKHSRGPSKSKLAGNNSNNKNLENAEAAEEKSRVFWGFVGNRLQQRMDYSNMPGTFFQKLGGHSDRVFP